MVILGHELHLDTAIAATPDGALAVTLTATCSCGEFEVLQRHWSLDGDTQEAFRLHVYAIEFDLDLQEA